MQRSRTANPGVTVTFNFGPSDGLATQINEGAPVDVFASASPTWMDAVQDDGPGVSGRTDFARNKLAIIVPSDNPAGIENLDDLTEDGVQLVIAAEGVPAGDYAREIFANAGIEDGAMANVVSNEEDVKAVITKVLAGDADAGIGYVTDVTPELADQISLDHDPRRRERHRHLPDRGGGRITRRPTSRSASSTTSSARAANPRRLRFPPRLVGVEHRQASPSSRLSASRSSRCRSSAS